MTDLIKREDAKEIIAKNDETDGTVPIFTGKMVQQMLDSLPSVEQDRPIDCEKCEVGNPCLYCKYDFKEKTNEIID